MTKISSNAVGDASKSMGEITYQKRGSTIIGTKRIRTNSSRTPAQQEQRKAFGMIGSLSKSLRPLLVETFETKEGMSVMNVFVKENKPYQNFVRENLKYDMLIPPIMQMADVLADPAFKGWVMAGNGTDTAQQSLSWGTAGDVNVEIALSREFEEGDNILIAVAYAFVRKDRMMERLRLFRKTLTKEDIEQMEEKDEFVANLTTMPDFDVMKHVPANASAVDLVIASFVHRKTGNKKDYCRSMFDLMPADGYLLDAATQTTRAGDMEMVITDKHPEAFAVILGDKLEGSILRIDEKGNGSTDDFPFKEYAKDGQGKINGIVVSPPPGVTAMLLESDVLAKKAWILKDEVKIADVTGIVRPILA